MCPCIREGELLFEPEATPAEIREFYVAIGKLFEGVPGQIRTAKSVQLGQVTELMLDTSQDAIFKDNKLSPLNTRQAFEARYGQEDLDAETAAAVFEEFAKAYTGVNLLVIVPGSSLGVSVSPVTQTTGHFYTQSPSGLESRANIGGKSNYPPVSDEQLQVAKTLVELTAGPSDPAGHGSLAVERLLSEFLELEEAHGADDISEDAFIDFMAAAQRTLKTQPANFSQEVVWEGGRAERSFPVEEADQGKPSVQVTYMRTDPANGRHVEGYLFIDEVAGRAGWDEGYVNDEANVNSNVGYVSPRALEVVKQALEGVRARPSY